jgi:hypothetical protein
MKLCYEKAIFYSNNQLFSFLNIINLFKITINASKGLTQNYFSITWN